MNATQYVAESGDKTIARRVLKANDAASRSKGLLGRSEMGADEGLWIVPCPMIHTFFMKFPIDVIFLKRDMSVARVIENLKPWRLSPWVFSAQSVLELKGGVLRGAVRKGDRVNVRPT